MENWVLFGVFAVLALFLLCLAAFFAYFARKKVLAWGSGLTAGLTGLEERMAALEEARTGAQKFAQQGLQAREQYANRRQEAIMAALQAYQAGKKPQEIVLGVAKAYPDVAAQYATNPLLALQDIKKLGITVPPELLAQLTSKAPPSDVRWD